MIVCVATVTTDPNTPMPPSRCMTRPLASRTFLFGLTLLSAPIMTVGGQTGGTPAESTAWQGWAFLRLGAASSVPWAVATAGHYALISAGGGVAASHGMVLGMVRATDSEPIVGQGVRDDALLIGMRSRSDYLFVAGAVGIDRATPRVTTDGAGNTTGSPQTAFAYDLSAHADYGIVGLALSVSGVVGPQRTSYGAVTLGAELGWFGR